ncbi:MAG: TolC family protein [Deltaproteobacteria bacterium]|nr:TolC family protein [Deltaproteobacteria bacterium]
MKQLHAVAILLVFSSLFTGCAVSTKPLVQEDVLKRMAADRGAMYKNQEPMNAVVTLEEAMARSIKYNLDHRLKIMEDALSMRQTDMMKYDMLPRLVAAAGYNQRDSYNASSSMNVATGIESLAPSTSQDKGHFNSDLTLTWNLLDFGVSYFQGKQQADRGHIMKERRRKVVHSIMQQVRQAYWLALGAQELNSRFEPLLKDVAKALQDSANIEQEKLRPPLETLTYRKTLLEIMKQLEAFRDELAQAKPRLASLMNFPLGQYFSLSPSKLEMLDLTSTLDQMEYKALFQRPELLEADYNERISVSETRKAILRMLPGIELSVGGHTDSNSFLVSNSWIDGGARLTWNLMNLLSGPSQYKIATSQVEIAQAQRLALSMAILTQVHVAYHDFYSRKRQYELSDQLQDIDARIHTQTMNQTKSGSQNQLSEIRSATASLMAEYRSYQNYASLQNSCGQIIATIGDDPLPKTVSSYEIKGLSGDIKAWLNGPAALCVPAPVVVAKPAAAVVAQTVPAAPAQLVPMIAAAPTLTLSVTPNTVTKGQSATLTWVSKNAIECKIKPEIGMVSPQGDKAITPTETTTYTVTCNGAGGATTDTAMVTVVETAVAQPQAASAQLCQTTVLSIQFDSARSVIKPRYYAELKKLADFLKAFPGASGEIAGYTDNMGFANKKLNNIILSQHRADNIRTYLIKNFGIDPKRITAKGYGSARPVADNNSEEGRRQNRRIETNFRCE